MNNIFIVGDDITVTGLKMAGMKNSVVATPETVDAALDGAGDSKIIVITHSLYRNAERKIRRMKERIVIEIPDASGGGEDVVNKIIRDVIGFEITKR